MLPAPGDVGTKPGRGLLVGVALVSCASLMLELVLTRIFSVTLFYHFAFLAVSLALFGIGTAGVVLYVRRTSFQSDKLARHLTIYAVLFGFSAIFSLWVVLTKKPPPRFGWGSLLDLSSLYLAGALPFFFSGMCLSLAVTLLQKHVSRVYFYDLSGAALGCLLTIPALNLLGGPAAFLSAAAVGTTAGALFYWGRRRFWIVAFLAACSWALVGTDVGLELFRVPSVKAIDESSVVYSRWNSFSRVTVSKTPEDFMWMNIDSDAATRIFSASAYRAGATANMRFSETRLAALVYALANGGPALIIGPGGGADVIAALQRGVKQVIGVELNGIIARDVMQDRFASYSGDLYKSPGVKIVVGEGRSFVRSSGLKYASIQATLVDTWAATNAGAFTLSENTLYTIEAFEDFIEHLEDRGILSMTRWLRSPPREFVRLVGLGVAALRRRGVSDCSRHFFVAADARMASFLLKKTPYTSDELELLRSSCSRDHLRVLYDPDRPRDRVDLMGRIIRSPKPESVWDSNPLDISPPTDDRPFFFYTTRPRDFFARLFGSAQEKNDIGVQLLAGLLVIVVFAVLLFIIVPLLAFRRADLKGSRGSKVLALLFFAAIGIGFIALEMAWMQHFVLFLGHPIYALGVVLFVLLLSSGTGSFLTRKIGEKEALQNLWPSVSLLSLVVVVYALGLGHLFKALVGLPLFARISLAAITIAIPGLLMGRMMPLGIKVLSLHAPEIIPWAWGVNGAASVLGSVMAVAVSMNMGYTITQVSAVAAYLLGTAMYWLAFRSRKGI